MEQVPKGDPDALPPQQPSSDVALLSTAEEPHRPRNPVELLTGYSNITEKRSDHPKDSSCA